MGFIHEVNNTDSSTPNANIDVVSLEDGVAGQVGNGFTLQPTAGLGLSYPFNYIAFGTVGALPQTANPAGFANTPLFGGPQMSMAATVSPAGFANTPLFGTPTPQPALTVSPAGFANTPLFGTPTWTPGPISRNVTGFANTPLFGTPGIVTTGSTDVSVTGFANTPLFGTPTWSPAGSRGASPASRTYPCSAHPRSPSNSSLPSPGLRTHRSLGLRRPSAPSR